jgi:hypothetical protein
VPRGTRGWSRREDDVGYGTLTLCGRPSQTVPLPSSFITPCETPHDPSLASKTGLGSSPFARRYSGNHGCFLFLRVMRCFSSPGLPRCTYEFSTTYHPITDDGFPHSDTLGSMSAYDSPRRFGVRPVLLRHLAPRHPPCALLHVTKSRVIYPVALLCRVPSLSRSRTKRTLPSSLSPLRALLGLYPAIRVIAHTISCRLPHTSRYWLTASCRCWWLCGSYLVVKEQKLNEIEDLV